MDTKNPDPTVCVSNTFLRLSPLYVDKEFPAIFVKVRWASSATSSAKLGVKANVAAPLPTLPETDGSAD